MKWLKRPYGDRGFVYRRPLFSSGGVVAVPFMEDVLLAEKMKQAGIIPKLLSAKIEVDARRWQQNGVVRQTLRNWGLLRKLKKGSHPRNWHQCTHGMIVNSMRTVGKRLTTLVHHPGLLLQARA